MIILGIDPGSTESGVVVWDSVARLVQFKSHLPNEQVQKLIREYNAKLGLDLIAIEWLTGYGIVAGDDTFQTCRWVGRFEETCEMCPARLISRKDVKRHLCGNTTTNDKYVRQALIDKIGPVGSKKSPGPTAGIAGHMWAALAVAVVAGETA